MNRLWLEIMKCEEELNAELFKLWSETFSNDQDALLPLFYNSLKKNSLLFIGCNPSLNQIGLKTVFRNTENEKIDFNDFYLWKNINEERIFKSIEFAEQAKLKHNYFKKFREISEELKLEWEHIDMFFVHETNQKLTEKQVLTNKRKLNDFGKHQIEITKQAISLIKPQIVVVANAFASDIFQQEFSCSFDDSYGCHFFKIIENKIPVFFTSMLTGQRALDKGSYFRLKWQIKMILQKSTIHND